jgi:hypothetical protein
VTSDNPKDVAAIAEGKCPMQLIPAVAEELTARVLEGGAADYGPFNWRDRPIALQTYIGAIMRHLNKIRRGIDIDDKSGLPHLAHIIATAAIVLDAGEHGMLIDDRPPRSVKCDPSTSSGSTCGGSSATFH